jgi:hypothetical protein
MKFQLGAPGKQQHCWRRDVEETMKNSILDPGDNGNLSEEAE